MTTPQVIAANRFGLGARPGDFQSIGDRPALWLLDQLSGPDRPPAEIRDLPNSASVLSDIQAMQRARRASRRDNSSGDAAVPAGDYVRTIRQHYVAQAGARYRVAASTNYPFHERLVHFWANHFAVSGDKQPIPALAGLFENEAIRPNVAGRFEDLLIAVEQHPAMILYLDNQRSVGPNSRLGKRANRRAGNRSIGINENLAREILELHTLGVDGGYSQQDVTRFAEIITGWSLGGAAENGRFADGKPGEFEFREAIHEPGPKSVLGKSYADTGVKQGESVLRDLAAHPSTARFLATKLARHFVADDPPRSLIDALSASYLDSGGDLATVYETLVTTDEVWTEEQRKYKTPHDFVVSAFRAFNHVPDDARFVVGALDLMGQTPYRPGSPAGWPDTAEEWGGADALYKRIEWCDTVARYVGSRARPVELGEAVLGSAFSSRTRAAVANAESGAQGLTLLLASPDFQRR